MKTRRLFIALTEGRSQQAYLTYQENVSGITVNLNKPELVRGFSIYLASDLGDDNENGYEVYTDDGIGNGDHEGSFKTLTDALLFVETQVNDLTK